jgi:hypothetical protein
MVPEKVGLKGVMRDGIDYEFTLVFDIDIKHQASASKDRTGLFADKPSKKLSFLDGKLLKNWCEIDLTMDEMKNLIHNCENIQSLTELFKKHPSFQEKLLVEFKQQRDKIESASASQKPALPNFNF